jgi:hypothetical protein
MVSSVDPTNEIEAIKTRLDGLTIGNSGLCYEGIPQGTVLPVDMFGAKYPYRDFSPGSLSPSGTQRMIAGGEQAQPYIFAFQIEHYASTRKAAVDLSIESDTSLIGWSPSTNASPIKPFYFQVYDELAKNGDRIGWIATRFYETTLGQTPDFSL